MKKRPNLNRLNNDNPEWTDADISNAVQFTGLPASLQVKLRRRPKTDQLKGRIKNHFDQEVIATF
ncbi:hypothetical protein HUU62_01470 [Rhodoferax sp. 4810]|uniref:Uncharacterized protein n=1 Tax=Thiospirillum jenense TaxID=1653858 RepID=A0A839H614_9GAMM|nr:hypothetical protein [Thiospirillum jenense]MBB1073084.1 hypothetical protein [Rhodoferax jenense]MBB1125031.1 hypothetical protein [Thiospirillum jenense]